ncbi:flavin reductase family protein [Robiginitalea sp. SC105]|uniref:flavin reductase family protein n=1 Tax=Robiginitalea sp. SC105 TaxID=2762332 RepID=UPI00163A0306|nr:flavin reductase family protein [Robiginitalea sp. SC105]MBC2837937.1 flavin reductase family protein [Robiginitalea sp. SC105]
MTEDTLSLLPEALETRELHAFLLGAVAPRPIAFASTVDADGNPNLAPFSYFNVFSTNPPVLIFSPARRVRDNTTKHTLQNAEKTREVVINMVSFAMVQQMSLASTEYPEGVNEFEKAGFTMRPSDLVKPYRVAESPAQFECRVTQVTPLGEGGGAGNLIFCEVVKFHLKKDILSSPGIPDPKKMDLVARLGGNWYSRAAAGLFEVPKPLSSLGIGVDAIPDAIRLSRVLTGNDLGKLGNVEKLPDARQVRAFVDGDVDARKVLSGRDEEALHRRAQKYLAEEDPESAWKLLLAGLQ